MHRLAFVSTAHIHTKDFLKHIAGSDGRATVHAVWDDVPQRGKRYAEQAGCAFVDDLDALVADDAVDGFLVCDATVHHMKRLEKVLPAGKPTLCEKQVVATAAEAQRVRQLVNQHGTKLCSGYFQPFSAANTAVTKAVDDGVFGDITHISFCNAHHAAYGRWFDNDDLKWFTQKQLALGGAMIDMGTHAVQWLTYLLGNVTQAWGAVGNASGQYPDVDDWGVGQLRFERGALGRAEGAWVKHGDKQPLEVWGSAGGLVPHGDGWAVKEAWNDPVPLPPAPAQPDRVDRLIALLEDALDPAEHRRELDANLRAVAVMEAVYRSAQSGKWEDVPAV